MDPVRPMAADRSPGDDVETRTREGRVLRVYRFRPLRGAFDRTMREIILPDLAARPGVLEVCAARKGPDETGARVVVSLWTSLAAMTDAMGMDLERLRFHPEQFAETTEHGLEVLPVMLALGRGGDLRTGILRMARGELGSLSIDRYAERVLAGIEADLSAGHGPTSIALAATGKRSFLTVSCWRDWATIERATGSSVEHPIHTMRISDMSSFTVSHLELLPIGR